MRWGRLAIARALPDLALLDFARPTQLAGPVSPGHITRSGSLLFVRVIPLRLLRSLPRPRRFAPLPKKLAKRLAFQIKPEAKPTLGRARAQRALPSGALGN